MSNLLLAYNLGAKLALHKCAQDLDVKVENHTEALEDILKQKSTAEVTTNVLDTSERPGTATWGDKMELETPKNTGLNV